MTALRCLICRCLFLRSIDYINHECAKGRK
jgi:hypothetical protein